MYKLVSRLITHSKKATLQQLAELVAQAGAAPFAADLLEVDEPLWGGFWQGDVIAPGYRLPGVELALLRAVRLDATWPEGTEVAQFLADLRQAISDPQAGVWVLAVAGEPCVVFASISSQKSVVSSQKSVVSNQKSEGGQRSAVGGHSPATVAWYCATTERLHAGYRAAEASLNFMGAVEQRPLRTSGGVHLESSSHFEPAQLNWLQQSLDQDKAGGRRPALRPKGVSNGSALSGLSLAARLDAEILRLRFNSSK
jgi:hypothetical protein